MRRRNGAVRANDPVTEAYQMAKKAAAKGGKKATTKEILVVGTKVKDVVKAAGLQSSGELIEAVSSRVPAPGAPARGGRPATTRTHRQTDDRAARWRACPPRWRDRAPRWSRRRARWRRAGRARAPRPTTAARRRRRAPARTPRARCCA